MKIKEIIEPILALIIGISALLWTVLVCFIFILNPYKGTLKQKMRWAKEGWAQGMKEINEYPKHEVKQNGTTK